MPVNFINEFVNITSKSTDVPKIFLKAGAYAIISDCFGRFYYIPKSHNQRPSLFIVIASAPNLTRRSHALKLVNIVKDSAFKSYTTAVNKGTPDNDAFLTQRKARLLEGGSTEGLMDTIQALKDKGATSFCLTSPEFGKTLKAIEHEKTYMSGFDDLLIRLWSGEAHLQSFSNGRERFLTPGTYFNILGGTQKIKHYLNKAMSDKGFVRRLLVISYEDYTDPHKPPLGYDSESTYEELTALGFKIGNMMFSTDTALKGTIKKGNQNNWLPLHFDEYVQNVVNDYEIKKYEQATENDENPYFLYQAAKWEHVLKIAANDALAKLQSKITKENLDTAFEFVETGTKNMQVILESLLMTDTKKQIENQNELLLRCLKKGYDRTRTLQYLSPYGIHKIEMEYLLDQLVENGRIVRRKDEWFSVC